jgi:predicted transcriptional regulator
LNVRRSRISILADILKIVREKGEIKPTHILYKANLSHPRMKKYLAALTEGGFIEAVEGKGIVYRITKKGEKFVSEVKKIEKLSDAFGVPI